MRIKRLKLRPPSHTHTHTHTHTFLLFLWQSQILLLFPTNQRTSVPSFCLAARLTTFTGNNARGCNIPYVLVTRESFDMSAYRQTVIVAMASLTCKRTKRGKSYSSCLGESWSYWLHQLIIDPLGENDTNQQSESHHILLLLPSFLMTYDRWK